MPDSSFMGVPGGANPGGFNMPIPGVGNTQTQSIGGTSNPLVPGYPTGNSAASASAFPAYSGGGDPNALLSALSGLNIGDSSAGPFPYTQASQGFHNAGYPNAIAGLLSAFLGGGAGFSPQVAASMIAALQPSIAQGQANIMEQFGSQGLSSGSPAAIGLAGFDSQATLDEGQILSNLYEQSVQNYMNVLLSGKKSASEMGGVGALAGGIGQLAGGLGSLVGGSNPTTGAGSGITGLLASLG